MILEVNSTKTMKEYEIQNPNMWNGMAGYVWNEASQSWENTGITDITKELIRDWFGYRKVCNDDKFDIFLRRKVNSTALRFAQLSRIELAAFDPLVANYVERQTIDERNRTNAGNSEKTTAGKNTDTSSHTSENATTDNSTRTPELTHSENFVNNGSKNDAESGANDTETDTVNQTDDTHENTGTTSSDASNVNKAAPQSISYLGATAGEIPKLDWQYITGQAQQGDKSTEARNETASNNTAGNDKTTGSNSRSLDSTNEDTRTGESKETGTDATVGITNANVTESTTRNSENDVNENATTSGIETEDGKSREITTGRGGLTPQEAFKTAASYLKTSSAWEWMSGELETCFLCVYDI